MKHSLIIAIVAFNFSILTPALAGNVLQCSHPELCRLARIVLEENQAAGFEFQSLVKIVGDPHEYEPSVSEVKSLIKAEMLITGPHELNPWIKKINYQRAKSPNTKTISLSLDKSDFALYTQGSQEALSHFWLYPKIFCGLKSRLEKEFLTMKVLTSLSSKKNCVNEEKKIENELKETLLNIKTPIVLTHDALLPLLRSLAPTATIAAIKGSGHHQESTPEDVKKLYSALKAPKVIWLEEKGINVPQNILAKKRSADSTLLIDTASSNGMQYFDILETLNLKLKAIKP